MLNITIQPMDAALLAMILPVINIAAFCIGARFKTLVNFFYPVAYCAKRTRGFWIVSAGGIAKAFHPLLFWIVEKQQYRGYKR